jgi:hypothetical protein
MAAIRKAFDPEQVTPRTRLILALGAETREIGRIPLE